MSFQTALDGPAVPTANKPGSATSHLVRRGHMYLGLFLAPWMFMYAVSTLVMNHREFVQSLYPTKAPVMVSERELDYRRTFPMDSTPQQIGQQILQDLDLEGMHRVSGGKDGKSLVIDRQHALAPRRITWDSNTGKLVIERQEFRSATFLERMHRRRGYQQPYALEDTWAFSVDVAVVAMVFWSLSGLWLWWELRPTRIWGTLSGALGLVLFALFLALL
jgi:hypothetical protein